MKKFLFTAVLTGLIATTAFAENVVSSANIVGYVQIETPDAGDFDLVALSQFSTDTNGASIQDIIQNLSNLNAAGVGNKANADKLYAWTGTDYGKWGLFQPTAGDPIWVELNDPAWDSSHMTPTEATNTFSRGRAIWIATGEGGSSTDITTSGDVYDDAHFEIKLTSTLALLAYPYSSDISLNNLVVFNATASSVGNKVNADKIFAWTGTGYGKWGLFQPTAGDPIWVELNDSAWDLSDMTPTEATNTINLGKGFWYDSPSGSKTIEFEQNYTLD